MREKKIEDTNISQRGLIAVFIAYVCMYMTHVAVQAFGERSEWGGVGEGLFFFPPPWRVQV